MSHRTHAAAGLGAVLALAAGLSGCAGSTPAASTSATASAPADGSAPVVDGVAQVKVTLTGGEDGDKCTADFGSAPAGPVTFTVENVSSTAITEVEIQSELKILGEKENLAPGLPPSPFTITMNGGQYTLYCLGATPQTQPFTVTGEAAAAPTGSTATLLNQGTKDYGTWVGTQADGLKAAVADLKAAVDSGDVAKAQAAYLAARPFYEKIESDVEGFVMPGFKVDDNKGNLDYLIDMRASNLDEKVGWSGFHAVERDLWKAGKISDGTKKYAADLDTNVGKLVDVVKTLEFKPEDLANGAAALLEEVQSGKITGEEEAFSHTDLVDFHSNMEGARQAFAYLQPGLEKIDPDLMNQVVTQFGNVDDALAELRDKTAPGGYLPWTAANREKHRKELSQAVLALQQPMQKIAEKVATAK
ncbi:iron uptake system protein EfeO [Micropruina sp.]|uniref:iron uptake system protein EfeO n=1 Tax=Micropruina sp. TaxID=2737536 RepID=UPI00260BE55C|nr:iron uptake system protein EfeO [Micropruina sp.]